ncbi:hypothetical protein GOODEAATRI_010759, partial [Goodea atripinnis]
TTEKKNIRSRETCQNLRGFSTDLSGEPSVCVTGSTSLVGSDPRAARSCGPRERSERRLGAPGRPAPKGGAPEQQNPVLPFRGNV